MGIIAYFRSLFSKNIFFKNDKKGQLVYVYHGKRGRIWFDKTITVPENMEFYFAKNGLVLDGFIKGEHDITPMYLSKTIKALKLNKKNKKVKNLKYFIADGYFISLKQSSTYDWKLFAKVELYDEKLGVFKAMLKGKYIVKVSNAKQFLKKLLIVYDYLKSGEAEQILEGFISESVYKTLMKKSVNLALLQDQNKLTDFLFDNLSKSFEKSGIEILGFSVEEVIFSKRIKTKIKQLQTQEQIHEKIKLLEESLPQFDDDEKENIEIEKEITKENESFFMSAENTFKDEMLLESESKAARVEQKHMLFEKELERANIQENENFYEVRAEKPENKNLGKLAEIQNVQLEKIDTNFGLNKIDRTANNEYNNFAKDKKVKKKKQKPIIESPSLKVQSAKLKNKQDAFFVKCPTCGENNEENSKNCVLCSQKL